MQFSEPPRKTPSENLLPMINVVFLLLIFFLIAATLAPPEPFAVTPPTAASGGEPGEGAVLYLGPDGALGFEGARDAAVWPALSAWRAGCGADCPTLRLRADAGAKAADLAALMAQLAEQGFARAALVAELN
jgi:biopolymer transport protein ExbD